MKISDLMGSSGFFKDAVEIKITSSQMNSIRFIISFQMIKNEQDEIEVIIIFHMDLIFIGPHSSLTVQFVDRLRNHFNVNLVEFDRPPQKGDANWTFFPVTNFHDLTIHIMDIEPNTLIYWSPFLKLDRCIEYPELAYVANSEAFEHIREVIQIHNSHLIVFSSDQVISKRSEQLKDEKVAPDPVNILGKSLFEGEQILLGYGKTTILRLGKIVSSLDDVSSGSTRVPIISVEYLSFIITSIINKKQYGLMHGMEEIRSIDAERDYVLLNDSKWKTD